MSSARRAGRGQPSKLKINIIWERSKEGGPRDRAGLGHT